MKEWVTLMIKSRGLRHVPRFQNSPRIKDNNVAEHSYYVALYTCILCEYLGFDDLAIKNMLIYSLLHDVHEGISIDIPNNLKRLTKESSGAIERTAMTEIFRDLPYDIELISSSAKHIPKMADMIDALIYSVEEHKMGNKFFLPIILEIKFGLEKHIKKFELRDRSAMDGFVADLFCALGIGDLVGKKADMTSMTHICRGFKDA